MENQLAIPNFSIALPDIHCWIKLIDVTKGTVIQNGAIVPGRVLVKYLIANEGATATGPFTVAWSLLKGGVIVPSATGSQQLTLPPMTVKVLTHTTRHLKSAHTSTRAACVPTGIPTR